MHRTETTILFIDFCDLTKAFNLVSRSDLFTLLQRIGCSPKVLKVIRSFHDKMQGTVQYYGSSSDPSSINSVIRQGCVLTPTLFGIFFLLLLKDAFDSSDDGIYICTRSAGKLFKLSMLIAKTKVRQMLIREMLFADDAALVAPTEE